MELSLCDAKEIAGFVKDTLTILGVLGALMFFGYKLLAGWLLINLTASVVPERCRDAGRSDDHLVVKIILEKGKIDAARLLGIEVRLSPIDSDVSPTITRDVTVRRLPSNNDKSINWDGDDVNNCLNLSPEERIELSEYFRVPSDVVYRIELVVTGDRFRDRAIPSLSQWRASAISLPPVRPATEAQPAVGGDAPPICGRPLN